MQNQQQAAAANASCAEFKNAKRQSVCRKLLFSRTLEQFPRKWDFPNGGNCKNLKKKQLKFQVACSALRCTYTPGVSAAHGDLQNGLSLFRVVFFRCFQRVKFVAGAICASPLITLVNLKAALRFRLVVALRTVTGREALGPSGRQIRRL